MQQPPHKQATTTRERIQQEEVKTKGQELAPKSLEFEKMDSLDP